METFTEAAEKRAGKSGMVFIRTTCKQCNEDLNDSVIGSGSKFCGKACRTKFKQKYTKP